ncbi:MAG: hypothetical protein HC922_05680 [Leptolyngbyaceae cyanobacterium SM2_3_12]|nr:hypothetical protein [Leptolyngbyaceae cyanobacterium SM2_3_12]
MRSNGKEAPIPKDGPSPVTPVIKEANPVSPAPVDDQAAEESKPAARTSRSRSSSRGEKKSAAPAQVITVEMTDDEQRIYAMMGISPMVLAGQEIPDPRNVRVAVVLPGQQPAISESSTPSPVLEPGETEDSDSPAETVPAGRSRSSRSAERAETQGSTPTPKRVVTKAQATLAQPSEPAPESTSAQAALSVAEVNLPTADQPSGNVANPEPGGRNRERGG